MPTVLSISGLALGRAVTAAPTFSQQSAPGGTVGVAYSYQFLADGSPTYALSTGSLPSGLSLSAGGLLSGTPLVATSYSFTVIATNGGGSTSSTGQNVTIVAGAASASAPNPLFATGAPLTPGAGQFTPQFSDPTTNADGSAVGTITGRTCYYSATAGVAAQRGGTAVSCTNGIALSGIASGVKYVAYTATTATGGESFASNEYPVTVS